MKGIKSCLFILMYLLTYSQQFYCKKAEKYLPSASFYPCHEIEKIFCNNIQFSKYNQFSLASKFISNENCKLCSFTIRNRHIPNSSPDDAILSSMFVKSFNLIPSLRSLRTTGSKCGMIIFTDSELFQKFNNSLLKFLEDCGCLIINVGKLSTSRKKTLFMARNLVIYKFLKINYKLLKRVIIIDLYDTIFQGDPFNDYFLNDAIGLSLETTKIQGSHIDGISILFGREKANQMCYKRKIINCGTILGSSQLVMKFLSLFLTFATNLDYLKFKELINTGYPDQAIVNALVCGNILDQHGIKYHLYTQSENYVSLHKIFRRKELNFSLGNFIFNSSYYPVLIHLFDRSRMFCKSVLDACPPYFDIPFDYIRCLNLFR